MTNTNFATPTADELVLGDDWSDLRRFRPMPDIDFQRLDRYRKARFKAVMREADVALSVLVSPVSIRYAVIRR